MHAHCLPASRALPASWALPACQLHVHLKMWEPQSRTVPVACTLLAGQQRADSAQAWAGPLPGEMFWQEGKSWGKIWLENCHRRPWQEKGSFFVGLQIIIIGRFQGEARHLRLNVLTVYWSFITICIVLVWITIWKIKTDCSYWLFHANCNHA